MRLARLASRGELGALGEGLAERELARRGWVLLGRNVHAASIEVDLVALEDDTLVCVEVKTALGDSRDPRFRPGRRVDRERIERQRRAARFLAERLSTPVRFRRVDLIEVWIDGERKRSRLEVHRALERPLDLES